MIAIVTDRPNVGREIARVLGAGRKENGYMTGNGYMVTWTYGNMLSLAMPKDSGTAHVEWKDFPLLPPSFLTVRHVKTDTGWNPDINAVLQLKVIAKVLNACDTIIAATDASREGEMLFRHLYGFLGCKQPCLRLWISSLTDEAITEGMANLLPCDRFDNLFLAADSRNRADWLLGVNSSYAICKAVGFGNNSLGRVQTPVLAEICRRYRDRENHMPADCWPVFISLCKNDRILKMRHVDDLVVRREALALYEDCKAAKSVRITAVGKRTEEIGAPALYNLAELQKDANRYHSLTAIQVQEIAQGLYEKKLISYPRTSSRLLPKDVYDTLPPVMERCCPARSSDNMPIRLTLPRHGTVLRHKTPWSIMPSSSQAHSPVNWTGRKCWFTRSLSAGCLKRSCRPARWNTQPSMRCAPHVNSASVHTASWKRMARNLREGTYCRKRPYALPGDAGIFSGRDTAGGRVQPYT